MVLGPTERFAELVETSGADLPLDEAVLLVAAHAIEGLDVARERRRLDEMAAGVSSRTFDALRDHLVGRLGFAGDVDDYHDPHNSLLPTVLDRRRGIPLTLAVVAMEVGRRCGVAVHGIGMPGHFLVRAADDADRYVDLYSGGSELDEAACREIFERLHPNAPWDPQFLTPAPPIAIVTRMLANLANSYRLAGDRAALQWAIDLRLRLPGASERDRRELALLFGAGGRYADAARLLEGTGRDEDSATAARLRARLN